MPASINITETPGADLCERCLKLTEINDNDEGFYEDKLPEGELTLRHKDESRSSHRLVKYASIWEDMAPEYPSLKASSAAGCELCTLLLEGLLRRNLKHSGLVTIACTYVWGGHAWGRNVSSQS